MNIKKLLFTHLLTLCFAVCTIFNIGAENLCSGKTDVSLLTCSPGRVFYQLEGHTALRIKYAGECDSTGTILRKPFDIVVNWGVFDFQSPNFIYRFLKGETDYMAAECPYQYFIESYRKENRKVVEQQINLTDEQTRKIVELVSENLRPENRTYRYNYVKDNCATRPLHLIEKVLQSQITIHPVDSIKFTTFRKEMARYHKNYPWYQFGIDLLLGSGLDYQLTERERTFAPVFLCEALKSAQFIDTCGNTQPVVTHTNVIINGRSEGVIDPPTPLLLSPIFVSALFLAVTIALCIADIRRKKLSLWFDSIMNSAFFIVGCMAAFMTFISTHEASSPNWLLLWLNPLCIIPAIGVWLKSCKRVVYCYQICNFASLVLLLAIHPLVGQALNPAFPAIIISAIIRSFTIIYTHKASVKTAPGIA